MKKFILFIGIFLISFSAIAKESKKEAIFIILGAGGRIDQEYNSYAKDLNKLGYKITIHSFDPYYGDGDMSEDREFRANIKECTDTIKDCETVENGIKNERFKNINYTIYEDSKRDFILAENKLKKNTVQLYRYTKGVTSNNRNGVFVKKLVENSVKENKKILFIDAVWCGGFQPITKTLFEKYKNKVAFIHAVHNNVQIINDKLIELSNDKKCTEASNDNVFTYKYRCVWNIFKIGKAYFDDGKKISQLLKKYDNFEDMSEEGRKEFIFAIGSFIDAVDKNQHSRSCINEMLNESKFTEINQEIVDEYWKDIKN